MAIDLRAVVAELEAALAALEDPIEGLSDILRVGVGNETNTAASGLKGKLESRKSLLTTTIASLNVLVADGYPSVPTVEVSDEVVADIAEQLRTLQVAKDFFLSPRAKRLESSFSRPIPKES